MKTKPERKAQYNINVSSFMLSSGVVLAVVVELPLEQSFLSAESRVYSFPDEQRYVVVSGSLG